MLSTNFRVKYTRSTTKSFNHTQKMVNEWTCIWLFAILFCFYTQGLCPGPGQPLCSSCINDTAVCSGRCIGYSTYSRNYITQICTGHTNKIRNIDLSFNSLNYLDFSRTPSIQLRILNVSHNNITIDDCNYWENNCFNAFKYLEYIDISFNRIKNSCNASVFPLTRLKHVNLSHNQITSIDNLAFFSGANKIRVADLSHNNISYLPWNLFQHKPYLISLNISYNNFQQFWFCHNLLLDTSHIYDFQIYKSNVSSPNDAGFRYDRKSQPSDLRSCNVSFSECNIMSSLCFEEIQCNVTKERLLFYPRKDSIVSNRSETNLCTFKFFIPCYLSEVGTKPLLIDIPATRERTFLDTEKGSSYAETLSTENTSWSTLHSTLPSRVILNELLLVSSATVVLSVCFVLFVCLLTLKLLQIIKERHYTQKLKYSVAGEVYTEINAEVQNVTNLQQIMDAENLSNGDMTREGYYFTIPKLEGSSLIPSSTDDVSDTEGSMGIYAVPNFTEGCPYVVNSDDGDTSGNAMSDLELLPQNISTENTKGSTCYQTLISSRDDINKDDYGINSTIVGIDGEDISQGAHTYEKPFLGEQPNCAQTTKESTSNVLESSFHKSKCLSYNIKTGVFEFKETCLDKIGSPNQTIEVGMDALNLVRSVSLDMIPDSCFLERSERMDQNVPKKQNAPYRYKSGSFDMLMNPCYASGTSHVENIDLSQDTSELAISKDGGPSERLHNYDQSFPLTKSERSIVFDTLLDEKIQTDCQYSMDMCRSKTQMSNQENTASTNVSDVHDDVLNDNQIETPEMVMNPWYQPVACHSNNQSPNKSVSSQLIENPFEFEITDTEDLKMLRNPCYTPIQVTTGSGDTEPTSGDVDSSQIPNVKDDPSMALQQKV